MATPGIRVDGQGRVVSRLLARKAGAKSYRATIGYSVPYALFVHENLEAFHPVGKAKFLSGPVRRLASQRRQMTAALLRSGMTLYHAVLSAAHAVKRESQKECPVDTGALRSSAFVVVTRA